LVIGYGLSMEHHRRLWEAYEAYDSMQYVAKVLLTMEWNEIEKH